MVLAVLGGRAVEDVAQEWDVESSLLHRWVRDFLVAGTAVITIQPDPDEARQRHRFLAAFSHELRPPVALARDLLAGRVPVVFSSELYATPALAGAAWAVLAQRQGWDVWVVALPGVAVCFGWRVLAIMRNWRAPVPSGPASV